MTSECIQTTLDDDYEPSPITEHDMKRLGQMLNRYPYHNMKLVVRRIGIDRRIRAQVRVNHIDRVVIEFAKRALRLKPRIDIYKGFWRITPTKSEQVRELLEMLLPYLDTTAQKRDDATIQLQLDDCW